MVRHNILQPSEPIDSVDGDQTEKIIHIFLGAAAMALFIVLLALVLGAFYCRSWKRWGIIFVYICIIIYHSRIKCGQEALTERCISQHHRVWSSLPKEDNSLSAGRVGDVGDSGLVSQEERIQDWLLEQTVGRSLGESGDMKKSVDSEMVDKPSDISVKQCENNISLMNNENELIVSKRCHSCS